MNTDSSDIIQCDRVFFNNLSLPKAAQRITALASQPKLSYVVTPNIDHLTRIAGANADTELMTIYEQASLSLCDSRIVDKLLRMKGKQLVEVIPGSTLTEYLFENTLSAEDRILIVGVEESEIAKLRARYPQLTILHINPSMGFINKPDEVTNLLEQIKSLQPHYTFLSVGSPRQEVLAHKMAQYTGIGGVALCVGASVLFLVGAERRAPAFWQKLHMEWAFRMLQSPKRLAKRYGMNFLALPSVFRIL